MEYLNWITNPRIIILGVLFIFIKFLVIEPLAARAEKFGEKLAVFESFVALSNSGMLALFIPIVFLVLLSDYPKLHGNSMLYIYRTGKHNWLFGQFLFLITAILTFLGLIFLLSILFSGGQLCYNWSDAVTKYNARFPDEAYNFDSQLLPSNLYNQIPMITAVLQTFFLIFEYLFLLALIIYAVKILFNNSFGLVVGLAIIVFGVITTSLSLDTMWIFPMANSIIWLHYDEIFSEPIYPIWCSFAYFGATISILIFINIIALKKLRLTEADQL
ncbi:MAG: hypothetical protein NC452_18200 [Eubacterium sp.]|nr:hypothetical protein [Eubacterium sp.]